MKLATEKLVLVNQEDGSQVDFSNVTTVDELKDCIISNYVVLCRKCASQKFCPFYEASEPPCQVLVKVVTNFIDMNIKSANVENRHYLTEFIKSIIYLCEIFYTFHNWRGVFVDDFFNWYYGSSHPWLNSFYAHNLLVNISKFVDSYRNVKTDRIKKYVIFVEGNSEFEALPPIFSAMGVLGITSEIRNSVRFINLEGKDRIQKDKIKMNLEKFKEDDVSYFLIIDNDSNVKDYIEDIKREGLLEDNQYTIWDNKFEDNFSEEVILEILKEVEKDIADQIDLDEYIKYNREKSDLAKSIEHLLKDKGIAFTFNDYKIEIAKRISERICSEIDESMRGESGGYDGGRTPTSKSFPEFINKIRKITEEIIRISEEYHVIKE